MTIPAAAKSTPIQTVNALVPIVDPQTGNLTSHGQQLFNSWYNFIVGMNRIIPCSASGKNLITLTPNDASPIIGKYTDYEAFPFVADQTSDGSVTLTVVPRKGALGTLKAYKTNGSAQAGSGDVTAGLLYVAYYVDSLDSGAGGFVLK